MRIAIVSDMHGNATAFESVIKDLRSQSPDQIVCLGDITMRGPQPEECIALLHSLHPKIVVRGNYDHLFTRFPQPEWKPEGYKDELVLQAIEYDCRYLNSAEQNWLGQLPLEASGKMGGVPVEMYHAAPDSLIEVTYPWAPPEDLDRLNRSEETKLVLFGHVHHAFVRQGNGRTIVNCGSVGSPFDGDPRASYAVIDIDKGDIAVQLRRVSYDQERALRIAKERNMPGIAYFEYALKEARYPYAVDRSLETV